jgi:hypothetical protein
MRPEQCHLTAAHLKPTGAIFLEADRRNADGCTGPPCCSWLVLPGTGQTQAIKANLSLADIPWRVLKNDKKHNRCAENHHQRRQLSKGYGCVGVQLEEQSACPAMSSADCKISIFGGTSWSAPAPQSPSPLLPWKRLVEGDTPP